MNILCLCMQINLSSQFIEFRNIFVFRQLLVPSYKIFSLERSTKLQKWVYLRWFDLWTCYYYEALMIVDNWFQ